MSHANFGLYPLQVRWTDFKWADKEAGAGDIILLIAAVAAFAAFVIILNVLKKRTKLLEGQSRTVSRRYSGFALRRMVKSLELRRDQFQMLDYVFKNDNVADIPRSLSSPDRHFLKAYRLIERTASAGETQKKLNLLFSTRNMLEFYSGLDDITTTRQIPENSEAVLSTAREKFPVKIFSVKGENVVVEHPGNALGTVIPFPNGSKVALSFFTKSSKGYSFVSRILNATESVKGPVLELNHTNQVKKISQRRFRRRQIVMEAYFFLVRLEETGRRRKAQKMVVDKRHVPGTIMDISAGGCSIKTKASVQAGTIMKIETSLSGSNIAVLGQALRTNRSGMSSIMHIKFLKIPQRALNLINALVYEYIEE
jgi:c-di-GMP-binding flagellar brake protein YcgR